MGYCLIKFNKNYMVLLISLFYSGLIFLLSQKTYLFQKYYLSLACLEVWKKI